MINTKVDFVDIVIDANLTDKTTALSVEYCILACVHCVVGCLRGGQYPRLLTEMIEMAKKYKQEMEA